MSEKEAAASSLTEKIGQLQKMLTASEHDRRVLQERLQSNRQQAQELKKQNAQLSERLHSTVHELEDCEVRRTEVETQLKDLQQVGIISNCFCTAFV